jgi:hypothetical protein
MGITKIFTGSILATAAVFAISQVHVRAGTNGANSSSYGEPVSDAMYEGLTYKASCWNETLSGKPTGNSRWTVASSCPDMKVHPARYPLFFIEHAENGANVVGPPFPECTGTCVTLWT